MSPFPVADSSETTPRPGQHTVWSRPEACIREVVSPIIMSWNRFYYGWVIVAVSFFTLFMALGTRYSYGVFFVAIVREYGWSRGATAGAFSLAMISHALFAPVTGTLIDRFGPRKLFPFGAMFLACGLVAASRITSLWHLYLFFGVFIAIGINTLSYSPHMSLIPKWFVRKRGLASGLALSGMGMGTMVLAPFCEFIIESLGWRSAFLILALFVLFITLPLAIIFHRRSPGEVGQRPYGIGEQPLNRAGHSSEEATPSTNGSKQWTLTEALRTKAFWYTALVAFSNGFVANMLLVHQVAHVVDAGFGEMLAASAFGLVGLIGSIGGIFCGFISDRVGRETGYTLGSSCTFLGIFLLLLIRDSSAPWMLYAFAILYGLGYGSMLPMTASTTGDLFPGNSLGRILAIQSIGFGFGGALGPYLGGYFHDLTGSYSFPFLLAMLSVAIGIFSMWMAAPRRARMT
jgi:MFS family permease